MTDYVDCGECPLISTGCKDRCMKAQALSPRKGDWIQTFSGRQFWPLDPRADEIYLEDVAHALSMLCRYNGHCEWFYSVAQHSVYVSHCVPKEFALWGLLHDAAEAYCCDLTRPVKKHLYEYQLVEERIMNAVKEKFGLVGPEPREVKYADNSVLLAEKRQLMKQPPKVWEETGVEEAKIAVTYWGSWAAERAFLSRFAQLSGVGA